MSTFKLNSFLENRNQKPSMPVVVNQVNNQSRVNGDGLYSPHKSDTQKDQDETNSDTTNVREISSSGSSFHPSQPKVDSNIQPKNSSYMLKSLGGSRKFNYPNTPPQQTLSPTAQYNSQSKNQALMTTFHAQNRQPMAQHLPYKNFHETAIPPLQKNARYHSGNPIHTQHNHYPLNQPRLNPRPKNTLDYMSMQSDVTSLQSNLAMLSLNRTNKPDGMEKVDSVLRSQLQFPARPPASHSSFDSNHLNSYPPRLSDVYTQIGSLIISSKRPRALLELSRWREFVPDLAPMLWYSYGVMTALLQEIISIYPLLYPPTLQSAQSNRVCNALALLQCIASHPETRQQFLNAHIPLFLYPFLNTVSTSRPFEYLRLTSLGVIGGLVKVDDPEVVSLLLRTEIISLCLRVMESGSELSKTVATFIVQKIISEEIGLRYVCATAERFYALSSVLGGMVASLTKNSSPRLLKHIIKCYLCLARNARAREGLRKCIPSALGDETLLNIVKDDPTAWQNLRALFIMFDIQPAPRVQDMNFYPETLSGTSQNPINPIQLHGTPAPQQFTPQHSLQTNMLKSVSTNQAYTNPLLHLRQQLSQQYTFPPPPQQQQRHASQQQQPAQLQSQQSVSQLLHHKQQQQPQHAQLQPQQTQQQTQPQQLLQQQPHLQTQHTQQLQQQTQQAQQQAQQHTQQQQTQQTQQIQQQTQQIQQQTQQIQQIQQPTPQIQQQTPAFSSNNVAVNSSFDKTGHGSSGTQFDSGRQGPHTMANGTDELLIGSTFS